MLSRTADNLFWMGRYLERAETMARLLHVGARMNLLPDTVDGFRSEWVSILHASGTHAAFEKKYGEAVERNVVTHLFFDRDNPSSVAACIAAARENARIVRTALSAPVWDALNGAYQELKGLERTPRSEISITELTERVIKLTPQILGSEICDYVTAEKGYTIAMRDEAGLYRGPEERALFDETGTAFPDEAVCYPVRHEFPLFRTELQYLGDPFVLPGARKRFRLILSNNTRHQQWLSVTVHAPAGFTVSPTARMNAFLDYAADVMTNAQRSGKAAVEFEVVAEAEMPDRHRYDFFVDIVSQGHVSRGIVPIVLLAGGSQTLYHDVLAQRQA